MILMMGLRTKCTKNAIKCDQLGQKYQYKSKGNFQSTAKTHYQISKLHTKLWTKLIKNVILTKKTCWSKPTVSFRSSFLDIFELTLISVKILSQKWFIDFVKVLTAPLPNFKSFEYLEKLQTPTYIMYVSKTCYLQNWLYWEQQSCLNSS